MKNLKKILSLALALTMTAGLFATTAFAKDADSYTDAGQINNKEAVSVLSGLGVIAGKGDGSSFDPTANVTRAEMAKMITWSVLGDVDVTAFIGTQVPLTDLGLAQWAEGYMKYCYSQGFISGRGDGRFDPNANVTTAEACRMLLGAIGYNSDVQVYTGVNWKINTIRDAQISHFFDNLSVAADKALSRDEAAQLIYNAVQTKTIVKTPTMDRVDGKISDMYSPSGDPLLQKTFNALIWIGTFEGNQKSGEATVKGEIKVLGRLDTEAESIKNAAYFPSDLDISNIGEQYKVIFKDGKTGSIAKTPDKNDTIYGVYKTGKTSVANATQGDVEDLKAAEQRIKVSGTKYDLADKVEVIKNFDSQQSVPYEKAKENDTVLTGATDKNSGLTDALKAVNGNTVKLVLNDQNKVEKIYVTETKIGVVSAVNSEYVSIVGNFSGRLKIADNDVYTGIAKDDVVTVTTLYNKDATAEGAYNIVKKADVVNGTLSAYRTTTQATVNGTAYKTYMEWDNAKIVPGVSIGSDNALTSFADSIGETLNLYMVNGYVGYAVQTSAAANNYSVIIENNDVDNFNGTFNGRKIVVLAADGTKTTLTVSDKSEKWDADNKKYVQVAKTAADAQLFKDGTLVTWTGNADNAKVRIENVTAPKDAVTYDKDAKTLNDVATAANAVLFKKGSDWTKTTAVNVRDQKTISGNVEYIVKDGRIVAVVMTNVTAVTPLTTSVAIGIVDDTPYTTQIDGDDYTVYSINGTEVKVKTKDVNTDVLKKGNIVAYAANTNNTFDDYTGFVKLSAADLAAAKQPDVTINDAHYAVVPALIKEHNTGDRTVTYYTATKEETVDGATKTVVNTDSIETKALASDLKVFYVDVNDNKAGSDYGGAISTYDGVNNYFNALLLVELDNTNQPKNTVSFAVVETSGKGNVFAQD